MAMPKIELEELQRLGQARTDDLIDWHNEQALQKKMAWIKASRADVDLEDDGHVPSSSLANWVVNFADQGISVVEGAVKAPLPKEAGNIFSRMKNYLAKNFKKGVVNITEGRKKRKYGIMFSGMGVGAIAGALIGTLLLPGIGTAAGGAIGAGIAAASPVVLGVITGVIGSAIGTFAGKRIAKRVAKGEDTYKLYKEPTENLKKLSGLDEIELTRLCAFIRNRQDSIPEDSPLYMALKQLRKKAFKEGSKSAFEQLVYFMVQEHQALKSQDQGEELNDFVVIHAALEKIAKAPKISAKVRQHVEAELKGELETSKPTTEPSGPSPEPKSQSDDNELKQAAEVLLKREVEQAESIAQLISAFERYQAHGVKLDDVRGNSLDAASIIKRLHKCEVQRQAGNENPDLGKIPYVHDKYGLQNKVEQLVREKPCEEAKVTVLSSRPRK